MSGELRIILSIGHDHVLEIKLLEHPGATLVTKIGGLRWIL